MPTPSGSTASTPRSRWGGAAWPSPISPSTEAQLARTGDYDAVFSGHTHERHEERFGDALWVNPGEILGWKGAPTLYLWDMEENDGRFVEI